MRTKTALWLMLVHLVILLLALVFALPGLDPLGVNIIIVLLLGYVVILAAVVQKYYFISIVHRLASDLGFNYYGSFSKEPRIKGLYREKEFQVHFRYKLGGKFRGAERTYIKLRLDKPHKLDNTQFSRFKHLHGYNIIAIKYVMRTNKQYLLMKVAGYITGKQKIKELMNQLDLVFKKTLLH